MILLQNFFRVLAVVPVSLVLLAAPCKGQPPAPADPELALLVAELAAQQAQIRTNHTEITAKIATIEESIRQARIFVSRGGRGGGAE